MYDVVVGFTFITILLILLLLFLYRTINAAQFPTIETKKLNPDEIINVVLIHNILIKKGIHVEHLQENKTMLINLCIKNKFSLEEDDINILYNALNTIDNSKF